MMSFNPQCIKSPYCSSKKINEWTHPHLFFIDFYVKILGGIFSDKP